MEAHLLADVALHTSEEKALIIKDCIAASIAQGGLKEKGIQVFYQGLQSQEKWQQFQGKRGPPSPVRYQNL